jgi:glycosyltransferase involved in cell wall biosynthesis
MSDDSGRSNRGFPTQRSLRVAITADPELPVPPALYGGIERIVDMLVRGLLDRGHEVTLFAHPQSNVPARLAPYPGSRSRSWTDLAQNTWHVSSLLLRGRYDLVHSFGRLAYLMPLLPLKLPKIMSYQRAISSRNVAWASRLARGSLHITSCSRHMLVTANYPCGHVIYNAASAQLYTFCPSVAPDAPLVFLGRIEPVKGAHIAIEVARRSSRSLIIAGNVPDSARKYFDEEVSPHVDGTSVQYIGPVNDAEKNDLLGAAAGFLMPILWDEPFGIVMAEALACGTPVIGLRRGSVPEVVQDGATGFVCDSIEDMVGAVPNLRSLDRRACRADMERRFSDTAMITAYEDLYHEVIQSWMKHGTAQ